MPALSKQYLLYKPNKYTFIYIFFIYRVLCMLRVPPINPHSFVRLINILEIRSSSLHKSLHFSASPNSVLSILCSTLNLMYKLGFQSLAASSVEADTHQRTMLSTSARWATRSVGSWCLRYFFLCIQLDSEVYTAPNPTCMRASLHPHDANYSHLEPTLNFSVATPPQKHQLCSINDSFPLIMFKIYKK